MTREEKQKAIDVLKISAPVIALTQEEFKDYIQTLNKIMDWLEQGDVLDKIRAEIDKQYDRVHPYNISCADGLEMALEIIDKYKTESEDKE